MKNLSGAAIGVDRALNVTSRTYTLAVKRPAKRTTTTCSVLAASTVQETGVAFESALNVVQGEAFLHAVVSDKALADCVLIARWATARASNRAQVRLREASLAMLPVSVLRD
jgi:hypothetical protein